MSQIRLIYIILSFTSRTKGGGPVRPKDMMLSLYILKEALRIKLYKQLRTDFKRFVTYINGSTKIMLI
jgi:hypothetical protein